MERGNEVSCKSFEGFIKCQFSGVGFCYIISCIRFNGSLSMGDDKTAPKLCGLCHWSMIWFP